MSLSTIEITRPGRDEMPDSGPSGLATSVGKALAVLTAFRGDGVLLGVTQVADRAGIPKSTAHRILAVLVDHGYVERAGVRYLLSRRMFELGNMVAECRPRSLRSISAPYLGNLYEETHATIHLGVLDGFDVLYVDKICGHNSVRMPTQIGSRTPALCSALGKSILASSDSAVRNQALGRVVPRLTSRTVVNVDVLRHSLDSARRSGVAYDVEGMRLGVHCVAASIRRGDHPIGAISLSFPATSRIPPHAESLLLRTVENISRAV